MSLESPSEIFAPKEHKEINFDDFLSGLEKSKKTIQIIHDEESVSIQKDKKELKLFENFFDNKLDFNELLKQVNPYEQKQSIKENKEQEKLLEYTKLADLSYIHLETNSSKK
jgi:hypothetical protein